MKSWETSGCEAERFFASRSCAGPFFLPALLISPRTIRAIGPEPVTVTRKIKYRKISHEGLFRHFVDRRTYSFLERLNHNVDKITVFLFSIRVIHVEEFCRR